MAAFYPSFSVVLIASNGVRVPAREMDVDAYNVTQSASEGTVTTDEYGIAAEGSLTANAGDVIEFSVSGYPGTLRFTLADTQANAYTRIENAPTTLVIDNLFTTTEESVHGDVFITDNSDPSVPAKKIGAIKAGEETVIPYQVTAQKDLRLHIVARSVKGQQTVTDFSRSTEFYDLTVPAPAGVKFLPLFDEFSDKATTGTARETLWTYSMPTGVLDHTGDKIAAEYAGTFAANGNSKRVYVTFAGTDIGDSGALTENATDWQARVTIIRASQTAARATVSFSSGVHHTPNYTEIAALDLDANGYDLKLDGHTSAAAGDITARMGHGMLLPRMPQTAFGTQAFGLQLQFVTGSITAAASQTSAGGMQLVFETPGVSHYVFTSDPPDDPGDWDDPILEFEPVS